MYVECSEFSVVGVTVKQFVPSDRRQSAYFDTFTGTFRKGDSANAFWTRYLETAIGWRFRIVQKAANELYGGFFLIVPPNQWYGQICQRLIFTVEPAMWRLTFEAQLYKFKSEFFYTRHGTELVPIFHHSSVVLTFDWVQQRLLLLVMHTSKCEFCYFKALR